MRRFRFTACLLLAFGTIASGQAGNAYSARVPGAQAAIRPMPPEIARRSESLHASLQPSSRTWVQQQAQIEARRTAFDPDALRTTIRRRFAGTSATATAPAGTALQNMDIDAMVFMVMSEAAQDQEQDLRNQMQQMQAMEKEKQALRELHDQMQQEMAQVKAGEGSGVCATQFCRALPARLAEMTRASAAMPRPFYLRAPESITYPTLSSLESQTDQALGSVSGMSQQQQIRMQMTMDQRSKIVEALSNMLKTLSDTSSAIVSNMK